MYLFFMKYMVVYFQGYKYATLKAQSNITFNEYIYARSSHKIEVWKSYSLLSVMLQPYPTIVHRKPRIPTPNPDPKAHPKQHLLEGNETGRVGGTNTGATVLDWVAIYWLVTVPNATQKRARGKTY